MAYDKNKDYTALMQQAAAAGDYQAAARYEQQYNEKVTDIINSGNNPNGYTLSNQYSQYLKDDGQNGASFEGGSESGGANQPPQAPATPQYTYNAQDDAAYMQALQALQQAQSNAPTYAGTYDAALENAYAQVLNREKFKYDVNSDALYQQYKDNYVNLGNMAMMDTMGQAAALTGGYGSSYGQSVGQQQYNAYLQQLNDVVPELYGMALDRYNAEGDRLMQQAAAIGDMQQAEYNRYLDEQSNYWQNLGFLQNQADTAYSRGYENWYNGMQMQQAAADREYQKQLDAWNMQQAEEQTAYDRQQDAYDQRQAEYDRLLEMIMSTGYVPNAYELDKAGMTQEQYAAWKAYYDMLNPAAPEVVYGGGGSGNGGGSGAGTSGNDDINEEYLYGKMNEGVSAGEVNGTLQALVNSGELDPTRAAQLMSAVTNYAIANGKAL